MTIKPVAARQTCSKDKPAVKPAVFWEEVKCNLCGSSDAKVLYEGTTDQDTEKMLKSYSASGNFVSKETLVKCCDCELVYTSPRLSREFILRAYSDNEDPSYVSQAEGRINSFRSCLKKVERFQKVGRVLDIGTAAGFFLKVAKDNGWTTFGIEPSKYLSSFGRKEYGLNVHTGTIEDAPAFDDKEMDVVTLWDVLEHTFEPTDVLNRCNRYLKSGGYVVVNYPNIANWMARLAGRNYWFIISVHLYYFTPKTIKSMLKKAGFEVVESGPHFQTLELGYLIYRLEAYFPRSARIMKYCARLVRCDKVLIPYYAAQTRVIARKVHNV